MIECRAPKSKKEFEQYFKLRWQVLRSPWQQPLGSEQDEFEKHSIHRCIIDDEQNILAVGRLQFIDQFTAQIRYMAVAQSAQGKGYGKRILQALEDEANIRGAQKVELQARENALAFYQQVEFKNVAKSHLLYDEIQHYKMTKILTPLIAHQKNSAEQLQNTWHKTIPLSKAMNIAISYFDKEQLVTQCDPIFNKNLHNTMFAGSIYTLATLTGWGWVYLQIKEDDCYGDIVLADAKIQYIAPIVGVVCAKTNIDFVVGDTKQLQQNKKARFNIDVEVLSGDIVAAKFSGKYVVIPKGKT